MAVGGPTWFLVAHQVAIGKGFVDLGIEVIPVGQYQKGKVTAEFAVNLAGEHYHRVALAQALCVPEDSQLVLLYLVLTYRFDGAVDAKKLVISCDDLLRFDAGRGHPSSTAHARRGSGSDLLIS